MIDLRFRNVFKRYFIQQRINSNAAHHKRLGGILPYSGLQEFWALRDVSFEVYRGEAVGIIGSNGAGKSTVLKLLSRVTTPTQGEILINGRLSALIEVGSGFHPELTGRENVYLSGSILGMRRREIASKLESIIEFAGIKDFIDTPVKRYSSGMYVRLGFAIAAHLNPDILLLDEVLAVGDASFQTKCLERIKDLRDNGTTIIFVSHQLPAVEKLCDRVVLLEHGQIKGNGPAREIIDLYNRLTQGASLSPLTGATVSADKSSIAPGETLVATWTGIPTPGAHDFIGMYRKSQKAERGNYASYAFTYDGSETFDPAAVGPASGSLNFVVPVGTPPATWELRLFSGDPSVLLARSEPIVVRAVVGTDTGSTSDSLSVSS